MSETTCPTWNAFLSKLVPNQTDREAFFRLFISLIAASSSSEQRS